MRLVFAGSPETALPSLRMLLASERHDVVAVVTRPDAEVGRGRKLRGCPVATEARERGIEVLTPRRAGDPEFLARLATLEPDCCPVVAYGALLPQSALDVPPHGWVNLHFSLLPAWRGAAPVQAAIAAGDEMTGATAFRIVPELDAGPIYGVVTEPIAARDTMGSLLERLARSGSDLLVSTMDGIADGVLDPRPQVEDGVSYARKVTGADTHVMLTRPALAVDRDVRAVTPDPGAWVRFRGERLKISPVSPVKRESVTDLPAGELLVGGGDVLVGTGTVPVRLGDVQAAGKKRMLAEDWARGARIERGERLE